MPHIHEKIDWTAGVYVVFKNKVLLRKHDKYGMWTHVGGHVELDEDPVTAAIRECKEEVGLHVKIFDNGSLPNDFEPYTRHLSLPAHMNIHYVGGTPHQHIDLLYYATSESDNVVPENDHDEWKWFTKEEIGENDEIGPQIKHYALLALETLGKT